MPTWLGKLFLSKPSDLSFSFLGPHNSFLDGSENQSLPAVRFREPLMHPVGHALQLPVPQRVFQNARPS